MSDAIIKLITATTVHVVIRTSVIVKSLCTLPIPLSTRRVFTKCCPQRSSAEFLLSACRMSAECPLSVCQVPTLAVGTRWTLDEHVADTLGGQHLMKTRQALGVIGNVIACHHMPVVY